MTQVCTILNQVKLFVFVTYQERGLRSSATRRTPVGFLRFYLVEYRDIVLRGA